MRRSGSIRAPRLPPFRLCPLLLSCIVAGGGPASAAGFYLQDQSAKGAGRAFSGEAADGGPDSLWWNPAAIAGIVASESFNSVAGILIGSTATDHGSTIGPEGRTPPVGGAGRIRDPISDGVLGSGGLAYRLDDRWALGFVATSPFSFVTQFPQESWTRYAALTSRLATIDLQPSLAWRPRPWLGLGIGPNVEYVVASLSNALPNLSPLSPDGIQTLHGSGWNVGFNAGLQVHLGDRLVLGAAYRSAIRHRTEGTLDVAGLDGPLAAENLAAEAGARFSTPGAATFALRWQATERLTLDAQAVRLGWSAFDAITVTGPVATRIPEDYRDTLSAAFGLEYSLWPRCVVRTGAQYDPTPTPGPARDPRVPDANRWLISAGTSVRVTPRLSVDAAVTYVDFQDSAITRNATAYAGTPAVLPIDLSGTVQASGIVLALGTRFRF